MLMLLVAGGGCNGEERRSLKNLVESNSVEAASNRETRGDALRRPVYVAVPLIVRHILGRHHLNGVVSTGRRKTWRPV